MTLNKKNIVHFGRPLVLAALILTGFAASTRAQEVSIPDPGLNAAIREALNKPVGPVTAQDMLGLTTLDARRRSISNVQGLETARNLFQLFLDSNSLTNLDLPNTLTNLVSAELFGNQLTNLTVPANLHRLGNLDLAFNHLASLNLPAGLNNLGTLVARDNQLTNLTLQADMTNLTFVDVGGNQLPSLTLPAGLKRLNNLDLSNNKLTSFTLPAGLTNLVVVFLQSNQLTNLTLSPDLINLFQIELPGNQLTSLTLPPDATNLSSLVLDGDPLTTFVLSEPQAATKLAFTVTTLRNQGASVFTYPLTVQLVQPEPLTGAFEFGITGPPGTYTVLGSKDLATWGAVGLTTNKLGAINFTDVTADSSPQKFYRAVRFDPPANMVFIPPNTFIMGSPTNEQDRNINEGPQTTVRLSHGFWIGQYEVTQAEYVAVMSNNPSFFPGDLSRPVSSVRWLDATNYCAKLTERELAAGRIPPGWHYRLPTEAEWECAGRAGTTTRFSYGDDPQYAQATNYMWEAFTAGLTVHPVGQKLPNPAGLYDMYGNVWEWCQDWYDTLPGGVQVDPTGPPGPVLFDSKVMRGGAYDYPNSSCRSASRLFFPATPFHTDTDLGFRVVLVAGPQ